MKSPQARGRALNNGIGSTVPTNLSLYAARKRQASKGSFFRLLGGVFDFFAVCLVCWFVCVFLCSVPVCCVCVFWFSIITGMIQYKK